MRAGTLQQPQSLAVMPVTIVAVVVSFVVSQCNVVRLRRLG
jgi:hypothetical protein